MRNNVIHKNQLTRSLRDNSSTKGVAASYNNKQLFLALFLQLFSLGLTTSAGAAPKLAAATQVESCSSYLVADAGSGEIIDSLGSDQARPPASMAKLMTAYVVLKRIKEGGASLDETVSITAEASKIGGSQVYLKEGEIFTIRDLLNALMIQSANDAALALALHIGGSREGFIEEMNQYAKSLGMANAQFHSPHGLPPSKDQSADTVSAVDMLILARALINEFPEFLEITKLEVLPFRDGAFEMRNHNGLLRSFEGTDGLKTGYYSEAGFCVTATALRKGVRLVAVLMGCPSSKFRNNLAASLFGKAFAQYKTIPMLKAGETVVTTMPVTAGIKSEVALLAKDAVAIVSRAANKESVEKRIKPCAALTAPLAKGSSCGLVEFVKNNTVLASTELIVAEDIAEAGLLKKLLGKAGF